MRFAQRFDAPSSQQVEIIMGHSFHEVALKVSEMVAEYCIRIVTMTQWESKDALVSRDAAFGATVVFEEDPANWSGQHTGARPL